MHVKHAALLKLKQAAFFLTNAACFRFNNAACFNNAVCLFSTCKINPDNFPATQNDHPRFSHTASLYHYSLRIR